MTSDKSSKWKSTRAFVKRAAKTSGLEILLSRGKAFCEGSRQKNVPAPASLEPAWSITFAPTPSSRHWAQHLHAPSEAGQQSYSSQRQSRTSMPGSPSPKKCLGGSLAILASAYGHARSSPQRPMMAQAQDRVLAMKPLSFSRQKRASFKKSSTQQRQNKQS
jgi:hypothetical protein